VTRWRQGEGTEHACASEALWALRPYLPPRLRLRLAVSRSPRALRRAALPLAGVLVGTLVVALIVWGARWLTPKPEIEWVDVPTGKFPMGTDPAVDSEMDTYSHETPQHPVYVDAYRIAKYEITNAQYAQCVRATVCEEPGSLQLYSDPTYSDHPVVYVSWFDARTFCDWIGGRLPTEAEWEYAARGPEGRIYPWGDEAPTCERAQNEGMGDRAKDTVPVGSLPDGASWCGVEDMAGNVWEWVNDWYSSEYYDISPDSNPPGPENGNTRVVRGGGWRYAYPKILRSAYRSYRDPASRDDDVGFRCCVASR
jgi:formylglycine-generating enzyme required for sulfatase activity